MYVSLRRTRAAFAASAPIGASSSVAHALSRLSASSFCCSRFAQFPTSANAAGSRCTTARPPIVARVDRGDEGFVNCGGCGADVLVSLAGFKGPDATTTVRCTECGRRWRAEAKSVVMLDGNANIVPAVTHDASGTDDRVGTARDVGIPASVKLYVGGLSPKLSKEALKDAFEEYGSVSDVVIVMDRVTGRSRGFGFVTIANISAAEAAISELNQSSKLGGKRLSVKLATDK